MLIEKEPEEPLNSFFGEFLLTVVISKNVVGIHEQRHICLFDQAWHHLALKGWIAITIEFSPTMAADKSYLATKFHDSSFSESRDL